MFLNCLKGLSQFALWLVALRAFWMISTRAHAHILPSIPTFVLAGISPSPLFTARFTP